MGTHHPLSCFFYGSLIRFYHSIGFSTSLLSPVFFCLSSNLAPLLGFVRLASVFSISRHHTALDSHLLVSPPLSTTSVLSLVYPLSSVFSFTTFFPISRLSISLFHLGHLSAAHLSFLERSPSML
jgi:hypothetical protein